ncbi:hypothetical protein E2562_000454 [Oryza meyeriana var. granulata]|uniref:Uncharacterized protein n=1 Tax=Oryza meyeriana var. granulata TaxID=110450 RepID=A0A6G1CC54_9ORYZ|nr:hypothetical protein E2562_000454 [Oryza meyeriana var. granulata]
MDVCQLINLYIELWDDDMPVGMLRRVIQHLGIGSAAVAVAVLEGQGRGGAGSREEGGFLAVLAPLALLLHGVAMVVLSVCVVARGPAAHRRCRLALAAARSLLAPFLLLLLAGLLQGDGREADDRYYAT